MHCLRESVTASDVTILILLGQTGETIKIFRSWYGADP